MASEKKPSGEGERRFRAVDVLTGVIDRSAPPKRPRKQISAYLHPEQVRRLGELHARLSSGAGPRVEKSEIVGLAIDLLADLAAAAEGDGVELASLDAIRAEYEARIRATTKRSR
jgi:hypothetical protein